MVWYVIMVVRKAVITIDIKSEIKNSFSQFRNCLLAVLHQVKVLRTNHPQKYKHCIHALSLKVDGRGQVASYRMLDYEVRC